MWIVSHLFQGALNNTLTCASLSTKQPDVPPSLNSSHIKEQNLETVLGSRLHYMDRRWHRAGKFSYLLEKCLMQS